MTLDISLCLALSAMHHRVWYALPLLVSVSLVYAATRHELMRPILDHALRFGSWLFGLLLVFLVVLATITNLL